VPIPGTPIRFPFQVFNGVNIGFHPCLNTQTSAVDSGQEPYIQALFNRFEEKHREMMSDIEAAKGKCVLIGGPVALHQADIEPFFFEKAFLHCHENRRFAG
jgi:hypothetical protein